MTLIYTVNAVIISVLTPGRSRKTPRYYGTIEQSDNERCNSTADTNAAKE
jgi:hypothetical protein